MTILEKVKILLNISDDMQDDLLKILIQHIQTNLCILYKINEIPSDLDFVIVELTIERFNLIGSEGMKKQSIEGLTQEFSSIDISKYHKIIMAVLDKKVNDKGVQFV